MILLKGRPLGIWILAGGVAGESGTFFAAGYELAGVGEWLAAAVAAGLGAVMLYKLFSIWSWHRTGWYALLSFAVVGALANGLELARGYGSGWTWASVVGGLAVALYLCLPPIREPFFGQHGRRRPAERAS
jgi:hypothetical protein